MNHIGFDKKFTLLAQEAHLAKNTLLSGFDLLLKANFFKNTDGYFYSAFFHLSIGMERILKLAVITHYMLGNDYRSPTVKQLKKNLGMMLVSSIASAKSLCQFTGSLVSQLRSCRLRMLDLSNFSLSMV